MRRVRVSLSRHRIIERCCGSLSSDVADEGIDVFRARKKDKKKSCARPGHTQIVVVFFSEGGKNPMFSRLLCMRPAASAAALSVVLLPSSSAFLSSEQQQEKSRAGDFDMAAVRRAIEAYRLRENTTKWTFLDRELSSDIAGETGAVYIYAGAARALKLRGERQYDDFVEAHEAAERQHLSFFEELLDRHTALLPLWRAAGFGLGFLPTFLAGPPALFATVESVESFVVEHYTHQIDHLRSLPVAAPQVTTNTSSQADTDELIRLLEFCCADELHHKDDARRRRLTAGGKKEIKEDNHGTGTKTIHHEDDDSIIIKLWDRIVRTGSAAAAEAARRI